MFLYFNGLNIHIQTSKLDSLLEGHTSLVTCAKFCPSKESIIVSISEDRTFKVPNHDGALH